MISFINKAILQIDVYLAAIGLIWCLVMFGYIITKLRRAIRVFLLSRIFPPEVTSYGEWAVVTGGSSGIGKSYAHLLARRGMNIVLISNDLEALELAAKEIGSECGVICRFIHADFAKDLEVFDRVMKEIGEKDIGILVNGAGIIGKSPCYFLEESESNALAMIDLHVGSVVNMTLKVLPAMLAKKKGVIINISSMSSLFPLPFCSIYSSCKAFSDRFTRALCWEYISSKDNNVSFQSLTPFFISTRILDNLSQYLTGTLAMNCEKFTASAVSTIGATNHTTGYWIHELIGFGITITPNVALSNATVFCKTVIKLI